jgi:hypothetical protein
MEAPPQDEEESDASSASESNDESEEGEIAVGWRFQGGYEDQGDVNIGGDRSIYTALDSDASDEEYDPSDASDVEDAADAVEISNDEVADLLEEADIDINDDDVLLKTAKKQGCHQVVGEDRLGRRYALHFIIYE